MQGQLAGAWGNKSDKKFQVRWEKPFSHLTCKLLTPQFLPDLLPPVPANCPWVSEDGVFVEGDIKLQKSFANLLDCSQSLVFLACDVNRECETKNNHQVGRSMGCKKKENERDCRGIFWSFWFAAFDTCLTDRSAQFVEQYYWCSQFNAIG